MMRDMAGRRITQTAGHDGDLINAPVVGGGTLAASPQQWPIYDGERIAAGVLHGLESGSIVALFTDPRQPAAQAKGHAELREVSATESLLRPIREYPCPFVNGTPECRDGGSDVLDGARYARLLAPPRDFALTVSSPRLAKGASAAQRSLAAADPRGHHRVRPKSRKAPPQRLRFADDEPDLIWWVTPQGFRLAPAGVDVAAFQTGAGVTISDAIAADERSTRRSARSNAPTGSSGCGGWRRMTPLARTNRASSSASMRAPT